MPFSDPINRPHFLEQIRKYKCETAIEFGIGAGQIGDYLKYNQPSLKLWGVEIWKPYINPLWDRYEVIYLADIRKVIDHLPRFDVILLSDVLEHFDKKEALALWAKCEQKANKIILLSLPIFGMEQGPYQGNVYESHLSQFSESDCLDMGCQLLEKNHNVGVFIKEIGGNSR